MRPKGVILYEGKSLINREPIVCIATFNTKNEKTGNLIQTWIMHQNIHPVEAINTGADEASCGDCPLRGIVMKKSESNYKGSVKRGTINRYRGCYVMVQNAPHNIWVAYQNNGYPLFDKNEHMRWFRGRGIRLGSYGEPVAVPLKVWKPFLGMKAAPGYTHQWRKRKFKHWSKFIMASTHSESEVLEANALGWRSYRSRRADTKLLDNEICCPATLEGGYKHTCESCGACNGGEVSRRSISTVIHGGTAVISGALKVIA
jgi:hypothetical protein